MWNQTCAVGVRVIDEQHGILLDSLNELNTALALGEDCESVKVRLERVAELARLHVTSEERLLELHGFPGLANYRAEREKLLHHLESRPPSCTSQSRHKQSDSVYELASFLRNWFVEHTQAGQEYGPWLQEQGV